MIYLLLLLIVETWGRIAGRKGTVILMLLVMSFIIGNRAVYVHTHLDSNGNIVIHSHPYNKEGDRLPLKTHHHSDAVLAFLGMTEQSLLPSQSTDIIFRDCRSEYVTNCYTNTYSLLPSSSVSGRGPPVI